ncbi:MAG: class I SAM-dependent methyltransferase [Alphaproteobacteria bacterium]
MTGTKNWTKEQILSKPVSIADVGCGLGFSAAYFVSEVVKVYDSEPGWTFTSPIALDLYDISPEHQNALQPLASLINEAYPQYFHVETSVHDAGEPFPSKKYRAVFAFNLMHYVPESKWPTVIQNIEEILEVGGTLFVTTDHYHIATWTTEQCQRLEGAAKERAENPSLSPFVSSLVPLVNPIYGDQFQTRTLNSSFDPFLKDPKGYVPGAPKGIEDIDIEAVGPILRRSAREHLKLRETVGLYDGEKLAETPVEEVMARLKDGRLFIQLGNYGFDESLLEKAILANSKGTLARLKISSWTKKLLKNRDGYLSSVGLTFTKK